MIEEVLPNRISELTAHFPGPQLGMVLAAVLEGNTEAQLWRIPQQGSQDVFLLWDQGNNVFYFSGQLLLPEIENELAALIQTTIRDIAVKEKLIYFKVKPLSTPLENAIPRIFRGIELHQTDKYFYTFPEQHGVAIPDLGLEGIQYQLIDADFLEQEKLENNCYVKAEVEWMWPSLARFRAKGFGIAAVLDAKIICWCTAEYVSTSQCGIGIEVIEEYQGKGIAAATAAHFIEYCLDRNIVPHWECDRDNVGSVRVAEKVGFEKSLETVFWSGRFQS